MAKNKPAPECSVSGALAAVLRMSRYAGIAPLTLRRDGSGWRASYSPALNIYGYCLVTILNVCIYINMIRDLGLSPEKAVHMQTPTRRIVCLVDLHLGMLITSVSVFGARRHTFAMMSCLSRVQKIHDQLEVYHGNSSYFTKKQITVFSVMWMVKSVIHVVANDYILAIKYDVTNPEDVAAFWTSIMYMSYYCSYLIVQLQILQFTMIALQVLYAFRAINDCLNNLLQGMAPRSVQPRHRSIRCLRSMHWTACGTVRDVNRSYGTILLLLLGSFLLHLVLSVNYFISSLLDHSGHSGHNTSFAETPYIVAYAVMQFTWSIHHASNLIMVIEPGHDTHSEMDKTRSLVGQLLVSARSVHEPAAEELELFCRHLLAARAQYAPLGVATLARSLVIAILGSMTTYLIILLQL